MSRIIKNLKAMAFGLAIAAFPASGFAGLAAPACGDGDALKKADPAPVACAGSFDAADYDAKAFPGLILDSFKEETGAGEWLLTGYADAKHGKLLNDVFEQVPASHTGTIRFEDKINTLAVLALFADDNFSLYLLNGGEDSFDRFKFSTEGIATDAKGKPYRLLGAALYEFEPAAASVDTDTSAADATVPVPAALPLFGALLMAGGFVAWRKQRKAAAEE